MQANYWAFSEYGAPEAVLTQTTQSIDPPGPGQALVKILSIGLNRSEFNYVQGKYVPVTQFPSCLGQEAVGEILELGPEDASKPEPVKPLAVGQRVALMPGRIDMLDTGSYRDLGIYEQNALAPVPESYSHAEGAGLWMGVLTMGGALELAGINPQNAREKTILITAAASSMGVIALKLLHAWGATTIATSRSTDKEAALSQLATHVVTCADAQELAAGVKEACGGFDAALDPVGEAFYPGLIDAANIGASIVSYEMITGREPTMPIATVMMKDIQLKGFTIFRPYRVPGLLDNLINTGLEYADDIRPIIASEFSLSDAPHAVAELGRSQHVGKIVMTP